MEYFSSIVDRNVEKVYPSKELLTSKLSAKTKLKIYLGIDPSSPKIHIGNAIALRKLAEFQNLGHKIFLLIGDFTGMIGDPTGRDALRKPLTREEVLQNSQNYKEQASKILKFTGKNPAEIVYNSKWLSKLNFEDIVKLSGHFTVQQMLERDMFQKRITEGRPIGLHEFLYPLMQGYDSVALDIDMEVGGSDQTFNMLIGRNLLKDLKGKDKLVLALPLLEGTDGRKMSKSYGNTIDITDSPNEMFGKIMSLKDALVLKYFELCTNVSLEELKVIQKRLQKENPINIKKELALDIVGQFHSEELSKKAEEEFERTVQHKETPTEVEEIEFSKKILPKPYTFFLVETGLCASNSESLRLASQGGVFFDDQAISNPRILFNPTKNSVLIKAGKRKYKIVKFI